MPVLAAAREASGMRELLAPAFGAGIRLEQLQRLGGRALLGEQPGEIVAHRQRVGLAREDGAIFFRRALNP